MCSVWHAVPPTTGLMCSVHLHPGWNVYRPLSPASILTTSTATVGSGRRTSSGDEKSLISMPAMCLPPVWCLQEQWRDGACRVATSGLPLDLVGRAVRAPGSGVDRAIEVSTEFGMDLVDR